MLLLLAALTSGCSSGGSGSSAPPAPPPPTPATSIQGVVIDDLLSGATVTAYQVTAAGAQGACVPATPTVAAPDCATATTDATGNYSINLGGYAGWVLLVTTGGSYTDSVTGETVDLSGTTISLSALVQITAPTTVTSQTAAVTPLTTLSAQLALALASQTQAGQTLDFANAVASANAAIQNYFGGLGNLLTTTLLNLATSNCANGASQSSIDMSVVIAGLAELANQNGVSTANLVAAVAADLIANGGQLLGTDSNGPILVPLLQPSNGQTTVALATIEGQSLAQALEAAMTAFESSAADTCGAKASDKVHDNMKKASSNPAQTTWAVEVSVSGLPASYAANSLKLDFTVSPAPGAPTDGSAYGFVAPTTLGLAVPAPGNGNWTLTAGTVLPPEDWAGFTWTISESKYTPPGVTCKFAGPGGTPEPSLAGGNSGIAFTGTGSAANNTPFTNFVEPIMVSCTVVTVAFTVQVSGLPANDSLTLVYALGSGATATQQVSANGLLTLASGLAVGTDFTIALQGQAPAGETCTVSPSSGTLEPSLTSSPSATVSCAATPPTAPLNGPGGLAFSAASNLLYAANGGANQVLAYQVARNSSNIVTSMTLAQVISTDMSNPSRLAFDPSGRYLFVTNTNANSVTVYDTQNSNAEITAAGGGALISGGHINRPLGLAVDSKYNVYVANNSGNDISVYTPNTAGSVAGGFTEASFSPLAADGSGNQFLAPGVLADYNGSGVGGNDFVLVGLGPGSGADVVLLYSAPLTATSTPVYTLTNSNCSTGPSGPTGLALTASAEPEIYVSSYYSSSVAGYGFDSFLRNGPACPVPDFSSSANSAIKQPEGLAVDGFSNIFVANSSASTITVYSPGAGLALAPVYTQH